MSDNVEPLRWSPPAVLVVLAWLGAGAAAAWLVLLFLSHADPPGQLLAAVATGGLLVAALVGTVARPRLAADPGGVTVRGLFGSRRYPWSRVSDIRVLRTRRLGRETTLVELDVRGDDGAEKLMLFGRLDLGEDPEEVAGQLSSRRLQ